MEEDFIKNIFNMSDKIVSPQDIVTKEYCKQTRDFMTNEFKEIRNAINDLALEVKGLPEKIHEKSDKRYASILTEKIVYALIGLIVSSVVIALIALVLK